MNESERIEANQPGATAAACTPSSATTLVDTMGASSSITYTAPANVTVRLICTGDVKVGEAQLHRATYSEQYQFLMGAGQSITVTTGPSSSALVSASATN